MPPRDYDRDGYPTDRFPRSRFEERLGSASCFLISYVVCIFLVLFLRSDVNQQIVSGDYRELTLLLCAIAVSIFLYFYATFSYPGYVGTARKVHATPTTDSDIESQRLLSASATASTSFASNVVQPAVVTIDVAPASTGDTVSSPAAPSAAAASTSTVIGSDGLETSERDRTWCGVCRHYKPARAKHCYKCGQCIIKFDHHCPFVGNCIGGRNHRRFLWYLLVQELCNLWGLKIALSIGRAHTTTTTVDESSPPSADEDLSIWVQILKYGLVGLLGLKVVVAGLLGSFHTFLMISGKTTWEVIKNQRRNDAAFIARNRIGAGSGSNGSTAAGACVPPIPPVPFVESNGTTPHTATPGNTSLAPVEESFSEGMFWNIWNFCLGYVKLEHTVPPVRAPPPPPTGVVTESTPTLELSSLNSSASGVISPVTAVAVQN